jgi:hypothetical protein
VPRGRAALLPGGADDQHRFLVIRHPCSLCRLAMIARVIGHDRPGPGTDTASLRPVSPLRIGVESV